MTTRTVIFIDEFAVWDEGSLFEMEESEMGEDEDVKEEAGSIEGQAPCEEASPEGTELQETADNPFFADDGGELAADDCDSDSAPCGEPIAEEPSCDGLKELRELKDAMVGFEASYNPSQPLSRVVMAMARLCLQDR